MNHDLRIMFWMCYTECKHLSILSVPDFQLINIIDNIEWATSLVLEIVL